MYQNSTGLIQSNLVSTRGITGLDIRNFYAGLGTLAKIHEKEGLKQWEAN